MVPADSHGIPRVPRYSGFPRRRGRLRVRGCHPLRPAVPGRSARLPHTDHGGPTTPTAPKRRRFGLFPFRSPLLGESLLFSFPAGTKMFQFPAFASAQLRGCHPFRMTGCPIRRPADRGLLAPPRGFSQLVTSFIASGSLGIHHAPFSTFAHSRGTTPRKAYALFHWLLVTSCHRSPSCGE